MLAIDKALRKNITATMYPKKTTPMYNNWKDRSLGVPAQQGYLTVRNTAKGSGSSGFRIWSCILHSWRHTSHRLLY